ncbi:hypothetical protein PMAYCL1PPCAC_26173, partial [Pristionchus mayeri]
GAVKTAISLPWNTSSNKSIELCGAQGAFPVMIKNQGQQDYWYSTRSSYHIYLSLGIVCNMKTNKWQWTDGSAISFKTNYDGALDSPCV